MDLSEREIQEVWEKATPIVGENPEEVRRDFKGNKIVRRLYGGDRNILGQWEAHHVKRQSDGGSDDISNLKPLQGKTNAELQ